MQKLEPLQNGQFGAKVKNAKSHSTRTLESFCAKNRSKNTKYSRNDAMFKIGPLAKAIAHAKATAFPKWSVWIKN